MKKNKANTTPTFVLKKEYLIGITGSIVAGCDDRTQEFEFNSGGYDSRMSFYCCEWGEGATMDTYHRVHVAYRDDSAYFKDFASRSEMDRFFAVYNGKKTVNLDELVETWKFDRY